MKTFVLSSAAAVAAFSMAGLAPAQAGGVVGPQSLLQSQPANASQSMVHDVRWRGRGRGVGIAAGLITLGVVGAIAANRAHARGYYDDDGYRYQCRRWHRWCRNGNDRACWNFDRRC